MPTKLARTWTVAAAAKLANARLEVDDLARLGIALAEAAAEEVIRDEAFAARVAALYTEVPAKAVQPKKASPFGVGLVPIKEIDGREINPAAPLDPYFLLDAYGPHQLEKALTLFPLSKLKQATDAIMARHPGTRPTSKSSKASVVEYIVGQLTH